ncbi:MAG: hypothetical protein MUO76_08930 [Anaerolineaceae bacterium]|nr:hypothetical protein [Anaerolineaceae bacterium]
MKDIQTQIVITLVILIISLACGSVSIGSTPTPTANLQETQAVEEQNRKATEDSAQQKSEAEARMTEIAAATQSMRATMDMQTTFDSATEQAIADAATSTAQAKEDAAARATQSFQATEGAKIAQATLQAESMYDLVESFYADDIISSTDGIYYQIDDYDASWAQISWYQWEPTGFSPSNFVLRAEIAYDSASNSANLAESGCGFVFRDTGNKNHYRFFYALDGYIYLTGLKNGTWLSLGRAYYGHPVIPSGDFSMILVAEGDTFTIFINGEKLHSRQDATHPDGYLHYTLASGTNKDYGTRCVMTEIELWELP